MSELLDAAVSLPTLLIALFVFGFAPGAALRLIVRLYPKGDPRRQEMIAELYAVPRWERPFWVTEQLEMALAATLGLRYRVLQTRWMAGRGYYAGTRDMLRMVRAVAREGNPKTSFLERNDGVHIHLRTLRQTRRPRWWHGIPSWRNSNLRQAVEHAMQYEVPRSEQ